MARIDDMLGSAAAGFAACFVVTIFILRFGRRKLSGARSEFHHGNNSNEMSIPRFGGIGLATAFIGLMCLPWHYLYGFEPNAQLWIIAGTALAMFSLGLWDDFRPLGAKRKLAGQIIICSVAYFLGLNIHVFKLPIGEHIIDLGILSWPITVFWLVAMTNLINLIDGVDGLAGGIALMVMILLTVVGGGTGIESPVAAGMVGALLAFLRFNFPPARIYLGDGGAYFLGFLIGGLTIYNSQKGTVIAALIAPLFVLALPILDTCLSLARRAINGLPLFRADQGHLHHRLLQSGLSRQNVTLGAYVFTAYFLGLGLMAFLWRGQFLALALGGSTAAVLLLAYRFHFSRSWFKIRTVLGNSFKARSEVNYALAHARWLAMEGTRGRNIQEICEDAAMIARRLGFISMRIQFENEESIWKMTDCPDWEFHVKQAKVVERDGLLPMDEGACCSYIFRHKLPGQPCFIELQTPNFNQAASDQCETPGAVRYPDITPSKYRILSEVLAEAWAKSVLDWHKQHKQPFYIVRSVAPKTLPAGFGLASAGAADIA